MGFRVVVVLDPPSVPDCFQTRVRELGAELSVGHCSTEDELISACGDANFILTHVGWYPFTRRVIEKLPQCKFIETLGNVHSPGVDLEAATEHGIGIIHHPGFLSEELSDHAMALILACSRWIVELDRRARAGNSLPLRSEEAFQHMGILRGKVLGLIGFGSSGRAMVPKAHGFGMKVLAYSRNIDKRLCEELGVEATEFDRLLEESDFVSLHVSPNPSTRHLIGMRELKKMKRGAFLVNITRGGIIDDAALDTALSEGYIAGAGLDVTEEDPPGVDYPLLRHTNVVFTGHQAGCSPDMRTLTWSFPLEQISKVIRGDWPSGVVNPEIKDRYIG